MQIFCDHLISDTTVLYVSPKAQTSWKMYGFHEAGCVVQIVCYAYMKVYIERKPYTYM